MKRRAFLIALAAVPLAAIVPPAPDASSVWLVAWGEDTVYSIYPKGSTAGLEHARIVRMLEEANELLDTQLWENAR